MIISETKDLDQIYRIFCDPEIYDRIADDGAPSIDDFVAVEPGDSVYYLTDENNIGLVFYHWKNCVTLEGHIQVLKEHRDQAIEFGGKCLQWAWENTDAQKIVVTVPEIYPDVVRFVMKFGFQVEGLCEGSYLKNSVLYDQMYLGISR